MNTILTEIFNARRRRVGELKRQTDLHALIDSARETRAKQKKLKLSSALENDGINIIAEFKRASPSKGAINETAHPAIIAQQYRRGGASAISVLTEEDFFQGSLDDLRQIRETVDIPILRKDFIFDEFQIYEAAAAGADAVLLIAAMLATDKLEQLRRLSEEDLGLDALVEVHTADEMQKAAAIGAKLIGVNNRDLHTFETSVDVSRALISRAPNGSLVVAESGLRTRDDLIELKDLGYAGFLIGGTLMRSANPERTLSELIGAKTVTLADGAV